MANEIQERIKKDQSILGYEVVGVDGCREPYSGVIKEVSIYDHNVLGKVVQVWVEWDNNIGHLSPYMPYQFENWEKRRGLGVYYRGREI